MSLADTLPSNHTVSCREDSYSYPPLPNLSGIGRFLQQAASDQGGHHPICYTQVQELAESGSLRGNQHRHHGEFKQKLITVRRLTQGISKVTTSTMPEVVTPRRQ
jgi:hypothetical protein